MPRLKAEIYRALKPAHLQAIGRVAAEWSGLELMFQILIPNVAEFDPYKCVMITKAAGIRDWQNMLRALIEHEYHDTSADKALVALYNKIDKLQKERNDIVHTSWDYKVIEEGLLKGTPIPPGDIASGIGIPKRGKQGPVTVRKSAAEMRRVAKEIDDARISLYAIVRAAKQRASKRRPLVQALMESANRGQPNPGTPHTPPVPSRA